ncbi:MAG: glycosyltransferase family 4 protein, partial [bacterium]|nr:glycosyltransferase family 4 protein [bacterium]
MATTKMILTLARLLLHHGHQVVFFATETKQEYEKSYTGLGVPIQRLPIDYPNLRSYSFKRLWKFKNLRRLLQQKVNLDIDVLVTCNDTSVFTFPVVAYSKLKKIPTVYYQEGSLGLTTFNVKENLGKFLRRVKSYLFDAVVYRWYGLTFRWFYALGLDCDYVFVYGTIAKEYYEKFFPPECVKLIGSVMMDHAIQPRTLKPNLNNRIIYPLQISVKYTNPDSLAKEIIKIAITVTQQGYFLFIKSRKDFDEVDRILRTELSPLIESNQVQLQTEGDAVDLLDDFDAMLVASSTVAYYALLKGLPIIQLKYMDAGFELDFYQYGASIPIYHTEELPAALHHALHNENARESLFQGMEQAIKRHLYQLDGKSGERFVRELEK